jgi:hypothetical protein
MARVVVTIVAVLFIGTMTVFTVIDFSQNGVTGLGVVGVLVLVVVGVGILGALFQKPPRPPPE